MRSFDFRGAKRGTTFVELLLYIAIFLVLTPILLMVSINAVRTNRQYQTERQVNADSQFVVERIYDLISQAKRVDTASSVLASGVGVLSLVMQDGSEVTIALNPATQKIEITEGGVTSDLTSGNLKVESLYFEKLADEVGDPEIVIGLNVRMNISSTDPNSVVQHYVTSSNLEKGDFDNDGSPDYIDDFPRNAECTMDSDSDGVCDELDNAVMAFNPFQEDYDGDQMGDVIDPSIYIYGEAEGQEGLGNLGGGAFNCATDDMIIDLIDAQPNIGTVKLKAILLGASPLSPTVLDHLILRQEEGGNELGETHFVDVFKQNCKLPGNVIDHVMAMQHLPTNKKNEILAAHNAAPAVLWQGDNRVAEIDYKVEHPAQNVVRFYDANVKLGVSTVEQRTDVFIVSVTSEGGPIYVSTQAGNSTKETTLTQPGTSQTDANGFQIAWDVRFGVNHVFRVSNLSNTAALDSITFNFSKLTPEGALPTITEPTGDAYHTKRFTYYCPGGCETGCGDVGTGILTGNILTDLCTNSQGGYPEWCSKWRTFSDDNDIGPAFLGGTQVGEKSLNWDKTFKTILVQSQLDHLASITVAGEIAYQSTAQFFCDQFQQSCPMNGTLMGSQDIQLYNWVTQTWETVGAPTLDGTKSDQQKFEVIYKNPDAVKFVGGEENRLIKSRFTFHWNGVPPQGQTSAPAFMLIDYFTLHMKW